MKEMQLKCLSAPECLGLASVAAGSIPQAGSGQYSQHHRARELQICLGEAVDGGIPDLRYATLANDLCT